MKRLFVFVVVSAITIGTIANHLKNKLSDISRDTENRLISDHAVGMRIAFCRVRQQELRFMLNPQKNNEFKRTDYSGNRRRHCGERTFATINWSSDIYFIKTETDPKAVPVIQ